MPPGRGGVPRGCKCWSAVGIPPRVCRLVPQKTPGSKPPTGHRRCGLGVCEPASSSPPPRVRSGGRLAGPRPAGPGFRKSLSASPGACAQCCSQQPQLAGTGQGPPLALLCPCPSPPGTLPGHANSPGPHATTRSLPAGGGASRRHSCSCQQSVPDTWLPVPGHVTQGYQGRDPPICPTQAPVQTPPRLSYIIMWVMSVPPQPLPTPRALESFVVHALLPEDSTGAAGRGEPCPSPSGCCRGARCGCQSHRQGAGITCWEKCTKSAT